MPLSDLNEFLEPSQITQNPEDLKVYSKDWAKHLKPQALAVVFPTSTEQVRQLVLWARQHKVALVPSGGRTGMSGSAVATKNELIVSFEKMNKILSFSPIDLSVECQAGVITEQLQNYAHEKGYCYPVDFAARGSSQIGGNIATNAGGIKVLRYGLTRQWVAGLKVVTGKGEVLEFNHGLVKNATGYDLRHLFIGSEGTLGFVTEATLTLTKKPEELRVMLLGVQDLTAVLNIYQEFRSQLPLTAYEMFTDRALSCVLHQGTLKNPLETPCPFYVLLEFENGSEKTLDLSMQLFEQAMEKEWVVDGTLSQNAQQAKEIWRLREDISEATAPYQPYKNDISVRISDVTSFLEELHQLLGQKYPNFEVVWFGHIGDGNLHINILKPSELSSEEFLNKCHEVDEVLFKMIARYKGSISAEHGVGLTKKPYLAFTRSLEEIQIMREIKKVFDPDGIINPGKIFDP